MPDKKLSIAHLHWGFPPIIGGVETHLTIIMPHMVAGGHKVSLLAGSAEGAPAEEDYMGAAVYRTPIMDLNWLNKRGLSGLDDEEALMFMQDMGIEQSARERLTRFAYEMLGYISFFTVGEDEVRAWTIRRGESAVEAAGEIHSELACGFIRGECFTYEDLIACGSEKGVKEKGLLRLEGKTYVVQDGDILHVRFSV